MWTHDSSKPIIQDDGKQARRTVQALVRNTNCVVTMADIDEKDEDCNDEADKAKFSIKK